MQKLTAPSSVETSWPRLHNTIYQAKLSNDLLALKQALTDGANTSELAHAEINAKDAIACPPLWYAAYWGRSNKMTQYLCEQGPDVRFRNIWDKDISCYDIGRDCASVINNFNS